MACVLATQNREQLLGAGWLAERLRTEGRAVPPMLEAACEGGSTARSADVSSGWMPLALEREAVLSLLGTEATRARIAHMLETGRPLRN